MKRLMTVLLAALLCTVLCVATFGAELDFSRNPSEEAYNLIVDGEYEVYPNMHTFITGSLEAGMGFGFKTSFKDHEWININLVNEAYFPDSNNGYLGNKGVTLLIYTSDCALIGRVVTENTSWDAPLVEFRTKDENVDLFGDGNWHKVYVTKSNGNWSITINGVELLEGITEEQSATLDTYLGGEIGFISFGSVSGKGQYMVCSPEYADAKIAEQTKAPEESGDITIDTFADEPTVETNQKPANTTDNTTNPVVDNGEKSSNSNLIIYIIAGVIALAAIVVIVVLIAKKKS